MALELLVLFNIHILCLNHKRYQSNPIDNTCGQHKALQVKRRLNNNTMLHYNNINITNIINKLLHEIFPDGLTYDVAGRDDVFSLIICNTESEARPAAALGVLAKIRVRTGLTASQDRHSLLSLQPGTKAVKVGSVTVGEPEEISSARISNSPVWL